MQRNFVSRFNADVFPYSRIDINSLIDSAPIPFSNRLLKKTFRNRFNACDRSGDGKPDKTELDDAFASVMTFHLLCNKQKFFLVLSRFGLSPRNHFLLSAPQI